MSKLKYNYNILNEIVKPNLENAINEMQATINASKMSIPRDFSHYSYLQNLPSIFISSKAKLSNCETWLINSINDINSTLEQIEQDTKNLEEIKLIEKNNSVIIL